MPGGCVGAYPPCGPASPRNRVGGKKPGLLGTWPIGLVLRWEASLLAAQRLGCGRGGAGTPRGLVQGGTGWGSCLAAPWLSLSDAGGWAATPAGNWGPRMSLLSLEGRRGCLCPSTWPSFLSSISVPSQEEGAGILEGPNNFKPKTAPWAAWSGVEGLGASYLREFAHFLPLYCDQM